MLKYKNQSLAAYLKKLASKTPVPGGGSATALVAATGVALISMVARYSLDKGRSRVVEAKIRRIIKKSDKVKDRLLDLVDLDAQAYMNVVKTRGEKEALRKKALRRAGDVPRLVAYSCYEALQMTPFLVKKGNQNLLSDVQVAVEMLLAAFRSAMINVEINR